MGVASWSFDLLWAVGGSGPAGGLLPAESRVAGWCSGVLPVWWVLGWGWLPGAGIGGTPAWWWAAGAVVVVVVCCGGCPCVVWGWHAVGVLGQCALGCPARPGFHFLGFWVGVGGLVVNCIVDASILL